MTETLYWPELHKPKTSCVVWKYMQQRLTNLKFQEAFKNIQKQRTTIPVSVKIISIFATKVFQLSFPKIFLLQRKRRKDIQWFTCKLQKKKEKQNIEINY